ncbi:MAG: LysM peptidoglycan-binding domain-containing protein [Gammaproteobacteria bacterium]|nr:LysM peptidoglycan-binding domain-containing protein [Gammaproteobacteria bacterium]
MENALATKACIKLNHIVGKLYVLALVSALTACSSIHTRPIDAKKVDLIDDKPSAWSAPWVNDDYPERWIVSPSAYSTGTPVLQGELAHQIPLEKEVYLEAGKRRPDGGFAYLNLVEPDNLWDRVREGFGLPYQENARIDANLNWYKRHPAYVNRVAARAARYLHYIIEETEKRGIPSEIALLPIVESAFQPFAYSHGRAAGIWQFIPSTGRLFKLKQNWWYDGRRDVLDSTRAALDLLEQLHRQFDGDWMLALAAYNSGHGTVKRAIRKNKKKQKPTDYWSLQLPDETEGYVPKLLAIAQIIENPENFNISLDPIANEPYMVMVETGSQIDLALAADLAEIDLEELYLLNPGFNRWATDPKGPHRLMVPVENVEIFEENLTKLDPNERIKWSRHEIQKGQSLLAIADKYSTTVKLIKEINNIRGNMIREGQSLIIPVATKNLSSYTFSAEQRLERIQNTKPKNRQKRIYRVRQGDTLWDISRKFGVNVRVLAKWNGIAPRDTLKSGQKLVIWSKGGSAIRAASQFSPHNRTQKIRYRVRRGDSLARISQKFRVNVKDLIRWNSLSKNKYLQPGQRLTLYVDVTKQGT